MGAEDTQEEAAEPTALTMPGPELASMRVPGGRAHRCEVPAS